MLVELDRVEGRRERWQFSLGCTWASVHIRLESLEPGGALLRAVVLGCAAIALALVGFGLVRDPGLRSEPNVWGAMIVFLATLWPTSRSRSFYPEARRGAQLQRVAMAWREDLLWASAGSSGRRPAVSPQGMGSSPPLPYQALLGPAIVAPSPDALPTMHGEGSQGMRQLACAVGRTRISFKVILRGRETREDDDLGDVLRSDREFLDERLSCFSGLVVGDVARQLGGDGAGLDHGDADLGLECLAQ